MTRRSLLLGVGAAYAGSAQGIRSERVLYVGATRVRVVVVDVKASGKHAPVYFHPHENEHSSAVLSRHALQQTGGRLVEIRSEGDRLITFKLKSDTYSFDPNRMFTDIGLQHSLNHFGPFSEPAFEAAKVLRNAVLNLLGKGKTPIIAVHNNTEDGISVFSYRPGAALEQQAAQIAVNPKEKPHSFFLVLDENLFQRLRHAGFNTVLQAAKPPDDGSLAVFCQQHHWPYINVEASESDMKQQERMLMFLPSVI